MAKLDSKSIEIKFGCDSHEINAELFIESLISYSFVTQEVSACLSPGTKINIKIKALNHGSFKVILELIMNAGIFIGTTADTISIVQGLYKLRKWFAKNGKPEVIKPIDKSNIEISNNRGKIVINQNVYNIYQENPKVREKLRDTFSKLKEEKEITDFSIRDIDTNMDIFRVEQEDFSLLAAPDDEAEQRKQKFIQERQELSVFKVVFKENYKWEFFYQGSKIYATIEDKVFFKEIERGERAFRSGDKLIVDLEIEQIFNEVVNIFVNDSYHVLRVIEHIPRVVLTQNSFDFLEDDNK